MRKTAFSHRLFRWFSLVLGVAAAFGVRAAQLIWDPIVPAPASYNVYYSAVDLPTQKRSAGADNFLNLDFLSAGKIYTLVVTAVSAEGDESDPSAPIIYSPTLSDAPAVVTAPNSQTIAAGQGFSLSVFATGATPLGYQWIKNGVDIPGATSATYSRGTSQLSDAGSYAVRVSNGIGSAVSGTAAITILFQPSITSQPASQTVNAGLGVALTVNATGSAPLSYQWFKNGAVIPGATSAAFSIATVQVGDNGLYTVRVSNQVGSASSSGATITVVTPPAITVQPQARTVNLGSPIPLSVTVTGSAPLSYQWLKFGANIPGANLSTLNISTATADDAGSYSVRVSNGAGTVTSVAVQVGVISPPAITTQPIAQTLNAGLPLALNVVAAGSIPLTFQWSKDGVDVAGATSADFTRAAVQGSDAGNYRVRISNAAGAVTSSIVAVTIITPPVITSQPSSQTVNFGSPINLSVQTTGTEPFTYQWRKDGVVIAGATNPTLQVASANTSDGGVYVVQVSNAAGLVTSLPAAVTVFLPNAPTITQQPQSINVNAGSPFSLTVNATGTGLITYQWLKNGLPLVGEINSALSVVSAQASHAGSYVVRVSNVGGSTLSSAATVTVGSPPSITVQPVSRSADAGLNTEFSVQVNGSSPFSYQWSRSGVAIPGATNPTLLLTQIKAADAGSYQVEISNNAGRVLSQSATLTVTGQPTITSQPQSQTIPHGGAFSLTVQANGAAPLVYRWIKSGSVIPAAISATYQVPNADQTHSGSYTVEISNGAGSITSQAATITVQPPVAPTITQQPASVQREPGAAMVLTAAANGTAPLTYQWLKNDTLIVGAISPTYQIASVQPSDAGSYKVRVNNIAGNAESQAAVLTVGTAPAITTQPASQTLQQGSPVTFTVVASGSAPLSYRWRKSGILIAGAVNSSYSIPQIATSDAGSYSVEVSNFAGNIVSQSAALTVITPPAITTQPVSRSVDVGGATTFSVEASGTGPLQYQWRRNNNPIAGPTGSTLQISPVTLADGGAYTVQVTGPGGNIVSQPATLTVTGAPAIVTDPQNQTLSVGSQLTLSVQATGAAPLNFVWRKGVAVISGATSATFTIPSAQVGDSGSYTVTVSNGAGSAASAAAIVSILNPPQITVQPISRTVNSGAPVSLTITATGSAPLSYQWLRFGNPIANATGATYSIPAAAEEHAGNYSVRVVNQVGSAVSANAQITVIVPPSITAQPVGRTLNAGSSLALSVTASGSLPLSYQWIKDGADISGANGAEFLRPAVQAIDAGSYSVRVSNPAGTDLSTTVPVVVITAPAITTQPASQTVNFASLLRLTVQVTGSQPLSFRWLKDGALIAGATTSIFEVGSAATSDGGVYTVEVSNAAGTVTSQPAVVSVALPDSPTINLQPQSVNVTVGSPINLTVQASGVGTLTYQWLKNGSPISGATSPQFAVAVAQSSDAGTYNVRVSNAGGSTLSASAVVTVGSPPAITRQPESQSALAGTDVLFFVEASGSAPLLYRWSRNGTFIVGATGPTLSINKVKSTDAGSYQVEVSNNVGTVISAAATLAVTGAPVITTQPANRSVPFGSAFSLVVSATGAQPLAYRWIRNGSPIAGATTATYQVAAADLTHSGEYSVEVSNGAGLVVSQTATVSVAQPPAPAIQQQPVGRTVEPGSATVFTVVASGLGDLSYQWFKNQTPVSGATGSSYQIPSVQANDAGIYTVQVSNIGGATTSAGAALVVGTPPAITAQPASQTVQSGDRVTLFVQASGTSPITYRWRKNGVLIVGAISSSFTIAQAVESDAGAYSVELSNMAGNLISDSAILSVKTAPKPPLITIQPVSRSVDVGNATVFFVEASGSDPLSYEWIHNGSPIAGGTSSALQISSVGIADAGTYLVKVSNAAGFVVSDPVQLTVTGAPTIIASPQGQSISVSNSLVLSVQVGGVPPFTYRWIKSGAYIPGATSSVYEVTFAQLTDAGSYSVEVSNAAGTVLSDPATVQVISIPIGNPGSTNGVAPGITGHPVAQSVEAGGSATFSVQASGTAPLTYAWIRNGSYIPDATNSIFTISSTIISDAGTYAVEVRNDFGTLVSSSANLSVIGAPVIRAHPQGKTLTVGSALDLNVDVAGAAPFTYRWIKGGVYIIGANGANFLIPAVQLTDAGAYSVEVTNGAGQVISQSANVTVLPVTEPGGPSGPVAPSFTTHPESITVEVGKPVTFTANATGTTPLMYRWIRNGAYIPGATSSTLTFDSTKVSDAGTYSVEVSNSVDTVVSDAATLIVSGAPEITRQPRSESVTVGGVVALSVDVTGAGPLSFRWIKGGAYIPTATNINLIIQSAQLTDAGTYAVEVSNPAGNLLSQSALVTVRPLDPNDPGPGTTVTPPFVTRDPISQTVPIGSPVTLSIEAVGSLPMTFKWIRNGSYVVGATSPILTIPSAGIANEGNYAVEISNEAGVILSKSVTLTLSGQPIVTKHPQSASLIIGEPLLLSVEASGSSPFAYRWIKSGVYIPNATNSIFRIPSVQSTDAGSYAVQVENALDEVVSLPASISVLSTETAIPNAPPRITLHPISQSINVGDDTTFTVSAVSASPLSYRWIKDGSFIPGAESANLAILSSRLIDVGSYSVEVSNDSGSVVSLIANLGIIGAPAIISQPQGQSLSVGDTLTLSVQFIGAEPMAFRWMKGGSPIAGATDRIFRIPTVQLGDAGSYSIEISNDAGRTVSQEAIVRVSVSGSIGGNLAIPVITKHPENQSVEVSSETVFTVEATSPSPLTYAWIHNGVYIPDATSATLRLAKTEIQDAGSYAVEVSSTNTTIISQTATLQVTGAPEIMLSPESQEVLAGEILFLSVDVLGAEPLSYRWVKNGVYIPGATNATYSVTNFANPDVGTYRVEVSNAGGLAISLPAFVTIGGAPFILSGPASGTVSLGSPLTLTVDLDGAPPFKYQWIKGGTVITGATNSTLHIPSAQLSDAGLYTVEVSNGAGFVVSAPGQITVTGAPIIVEQPASQTTPVGSPFTLNVEVAGVAPFTFHWIKGGAYIPDATSKTYSVASAKLSDSGAYSVEVSNGAGQIVSAVASVQVISTNTGGGGSNGNEGIVITQHPQSQVIDAGAEAVFTIEATGPAELTYLWSHNGTFIAGATDPTLILTNLTLASAGTYAVQITSSNLIATSATATLTVIGAPVITKHPENQSIPINGMLELKVDVRGAQPISYAWIRNGAYIPGATSQNFVVPSVALSNGGTYSVEISNGAGSVVSRTAQVVITGAPIVLTPPAAQTVPIGGTFTLTVDVDGTAPFTYNWIKGGAYIPNATNSTFTVSSAQLSHAGLYSVEVSNGAGQAVSANAQVTITEAPVILQQPSSQSVAVGSAISLSVEVGGADPFTFRWLKDGAPIADATSRTFVIASAKISDSGSYLVEVNNSKGQAISQSATITVTNQTTSSDLKLAIQPSLLGFAEITITAPPGSYDIQFTPDIAAPVWQTLLTTNISAITTFSIPVDNAKQQFFRIFFDDE